MIRPTDGLCSSNSCNGRLLRAPRGSRIAVGFRAKTSGILYVFTSDLFFRIAVYCGSLTVSALLRVSSVAHCCWKRLAAESKRVLQWSTAIVGSSVRGALLWDRLGVYTESGYTLLLQSVPKPRCFAACVFDGSHLLYLLGGGRDPHGSNGDLRPRGCAVDSFDMHKGSWAIKPDMTTGRMQCGACRVGKEVLAMGGFCATTFDFRSPNRRDILDSIDVCDLTDGSWQRRNSLLCRRHDFALASVADKIYVIGGLTQLTGEPAGSDGQLRSRICDSVEVISESGKTIRSCSTMPVPVSGGHAVVVGNRILVLDRLEPEPRYAFGLDLGSRKPMQEFNTLTGIWTILRDLPRSNSVIDALCYDSGMCVHTGTSISIFGGFNSGNEMFVELITDETFQRWKIKRSRWCFATGVAVSLASM